DLSGEKPRITEVIKTNAKGETELVLKPVEGKENTWSAEKLGEIKGELSVSPEGKLIFSQTVASDRGTFKIVGRDENGEIQTLSSEFKDGEKPEVWKRVGDSNWWTSDSGKMNCARVENGEFQAIDAQDLAAQKESLDKVAVHAIKDEKQRAEFLANVEAFLTRAQKDGISNAEVAKSLEHLSRLMVAPDGKTAITQDDRVKIAQQAIRQAADPTTIDQGQNNTCNVTTVENLLYTKQPSVVFKVIADVATTGSFKTIDGKTIAIHPSCLKPDNEARNHPTIDGDRSYASQLFQHAAIATYWQSDADSKLRYVKLESRLGRTDTGERVAEVDANGNLTGKFLNDHEGKMIKSPHFGAYQMEKAWEALGGTPRYCQISGTFKNEYKENNKPIPRGRATDHFRTGIDPGVFGGYKVDSPESLGKLIKQLEDSKSLPIIMRVNASKPPFAPKSDKIDKNDHAAHVVVIRGIIPGPPAKAIVDNQWGKESDKHVLLTDLFGALD
ncbi:MAG: hypothetical protein K2X81_24950, partial [Candidatus Obscuribacterales bacterium]|nr:hypothetical protein [Candidatus Obscuribacterales bacterium]